MSGGWGLVFAALYFHADIDAVVCLILGLGLGLGLGLLGWFVE
jgi:hypothetical protein